MVTLQVANALGHLYIWKTMSQIPLLPQVTAVHLIQDTSLHLAYLHLFKIRFTFPVCWIPAVRQTATILQVMASPITKLP